LVPPPPTSPLFPYTTLFRSRDVIAAFENTGNFHIVAHVDGRDALNDWIARGDAQAGIAIPHDFPRNLARGTTATIQVIVDASDPDRKSTRLNSSHGSISHAV